MSEPNGQFWKSDAHAQHVENVVKEYPIGAKEGIVHYIERICVLSGLMDRKWCTYLKPHEDIEVGQKLKLVVSEEW